MEIIFLKGSSNEGRRIHAPTYTPEIGTLPSVVSVTNLPIQTTACDMRIKKEKLTNISSKGKCSSTSPRIRDTKSSFSSEILKQSGAKDPSISDGRKTQKRVFDGKDCRPKKKVSEKHVSDISESKNESRKQICEQTEPKLCDDNKIIEIQQTDDEEESRNISPKVKRKSGTRKEIDNSDTNEKSNTDHNVKATTEINIISDDEIQDLTTDKKSDNSYPNVHSKTVPIPSGIRYSQMKPSTQTKLSEKLLRSRELGKKGSKHKEDGSSGMYEIISINHLT